MTVVPTVQEESEGNQRGEQKQKESKSRRRKQGEDDISDLLFAREANMVVVDGVSGHHVQTPRVFVLATPQSLCEGRAYSIRSREADDRQQKADRK
jgi:hypothetical protein